jgi:UDP-N-acetylmuramoyl-tripeptide--D-alanyl-D-alanine ligase
MEGATPDSLLIANADDAYVMSRAHQFPGQVVTFGIHAPADVKAGDVRDRGLSGIEATITTSEASLPLRVPLLGLGQFANVLAAVTVALQFQIPLHTIAAEASALKPFVHRGEVFRLRNDIVVVDDSYNSSPSALTVALEILNTEKADGRRVAVLGEMRELGSRGRELHRHSGLMAAKCGLDLLVSVGGPDAIALADGAVDGGLNPEQVHHVTTSDEAGPLTASLLQTSDLVVVKGSRGVQTDLVVEYLKSELA